MDILEAIAGEFPDSHISEARLVEREDGSLLVAGWMPVDEFAERLGFRLDEGRDYETVAGLVIDRMGKLPQLGEYVKVAGWRLEVVDLDGRRIDKLLVSRQTDG
jgi:putative hemolysin